MEKRIQSYRCVYIIRMIKIALYFVYDNNMVVALCICLISQSNYCTTQSTTTDQTAALLPFQANNYLIKAHYERVGGVHPLEVQRYTPPVQVHHSVSATPLGRC